MYPLKYKLSLIFLLLLLSVLFGYLTFTSLASSEADSSYIINTIPDAFIFSAVVIILSPVIFGVNVIWPIFLVSSAAILVASTSLGRHIYSLQIFAILCISLIIYFFYKRKFDIVENDITSTQKIKESTNLLKSQSIKAKKVNRALSDRLGRYRNLREIGESFSAKLSLQEIYNLAADTAFSMIPNSDAALLFMIDEQNQNLMLTSSKAKSELPRVKSKNGDIFDQWVFKERQLLHVENIDGDFRFDYKPLQRERLFASLISVPLIAQSRIIGILRLNSRYKNAYTFDDLRLLDFISGLVSSAVNNARLYETTEELSTKDSLTGFYIHRYLKERLSEEVDRARLNNSRLSVIMFDIDHFKDYNDKYGHSAGDKVLLGISKIIRDKLKNGYTVARYGGEEFAVLLPGVDKEKAREIADTLRKEIESRKFTLRRKQTRVTVSAGVSAYSEEAQDREDLLKKADFCLYKAKKEGRNQVCVA
ncbi:MAG: sensor domain-containing diguanylate cyclase [Candidatus Omnitrophica bacterium]|nr:sensor domain-containing diguanylate cyclase [Candidatus Omnitrophota bacterium]